MAYVIRFPTLYIAEYNVANVDGIQSDVALHSQVH